MNKAHSIARKVLAPRTTTLSFQILRLRYPDIFTIPPGRCLAREEKLYQQGRFPPLIGIKRA